MKRVLFVDDDEDILFCYRMLVESGDVIVHTAHEIGVALDVVRENKVDVAVLDYMMPEVTGDELARLINRIDPGVKIFFVSGYDVAVEAIKRLNVAVYGVYMKPIDPSMLRKIVDAEEYVSAGYRAMSVNFGNQYTNVFCGLG